LLLFAVRIVVFAIVWLLTWGKLSFWLLPNLTEDVGFFDSFRPVYQCTFAQSESGDGDTTAGSCDADKSLELADAAEGEEEKSGDHVEEVEGNSSSFLGEAVSRALSVERRVSRAPQFTNYLG